MYCYCVRKKGKVEEQETPKVAVGKTEAEKRFEEKKRQREEQRLKEEAQLSYRSKIEVSGVPCLSLDILNLV